EAAAQAAALSERGVAAKQPVPIGPAPTRSAAPPQAQAAAEPEPAAAQAAASEPAASPGTSEPAASEPAASEPAPTQSAAAADGAGAGGDAGGSPAETEYRLWLVSADTAVAAEDLRRETLARHGEALGGVELDIYEMDYGERGHFYRILAGPLYSADAAADLCQRLRQDDPEGFCKVLAR
ncbi:MAG: SPOR domain-containing protein, partial [Kiloniellales bacterium]|nr:SPOR domain-containing protein [Kiloniellales bacterium]